MERSSSEWAQEGTDPIIPNTEHGPVGRNSDTSNRNVLLGHKMMCAFALAEIPDAHIPASVDADQLPLVGMNDDVVDRKAAGVGIVALDRRRAGIPDLDRAVLRACDEPFPFTMPSDARHVARVSLEGEHGVRVRVFDVIELD